VGDDPAQQYFADGMTEGVTAHLAQAGGFQVTSRTSAMHYKHTTKPRAAIGRELQVDAIVEGSVTRSGDQVRISAQVTPVSADRQIWTRQYDGNLQDVMALQDRIAQAIVEAISGRSGRAAPARHSLAERTVTPKAYDAYLKGLSTAARGNIAGFRSAVVYFEEAIAGQPDFAMAHAALAQVQLQMLFTGPQSPGEVMPKAEASARRAIALDDALPGGHRVLGQILHNYHWRWEEGDREIGRALELDGNSVEALALRAFALIRTGRFEEAIAHAERARQRDPLSFTASMNLGSALRAGGQYDRAIAEFRRGLTLDPYGQRAHFQIGVTFGFMRRWPHAITELETAHRMAPNNAWHRAYLGYAYAMGGRQDEARKILDDLEARGKKHYVSSFSIAFLRDALGEKEPAMAALQRAYDEHAIEFAQLRQYPAFQSIGDDPRYAAMMRGFRPH
jgi:TolB-like protein/Tfp pilus assembly protein PilF